MSQKKVELWVGLFITTAVLSLAILAFSVAGLSLHGEGKSYTLHANFSNVGGLKVRAPNKPDVKIAKEDVSG